MADKLVRTVCVKLDVGPHADVLALTMRTFNEAATWIAGVCWREHISNTNTAHHRVYRETRQRYGLGSQLAVCARARAVEAIKAGKQRMKETCPTFGPRGAVRYDANSYRLMRLDGVSLSTIAGRVQCQMLPGARQHTLLVDRTWTIGGADLCWRDGVYYLHITQSRQAPAQAESDGVLGVDLGIVHIATDSDGDTFSGAPIDGLRAYHLRRRQLLQPIKTRSARKKLGRARRRESRFSRDTNHRLSKALVIKAATSCKTLALEDLTHIRERVHVRHGQRSRHHSWAFSQLRLYLTYKAASAGVRVVLVDPRHTSTTCHRCGHCERANRQSQASFRCRSCGFSCSADWNGACNIASRAAANRPMVPPDINVVCGKGQAHSL